MKINQLIKALTLSGVALFLSGCGHHRYFEGLEDIPSGVASIYVIRPNQFVGAAADMRLKVDDEMLGYLRGGHFLNTFIEPGRHSVSVESGDIFHRQERRQAFSVKPNERVYFMARFGLEGYFGIEQIDPEIALQELKEFTKE